MRICLKNFIQIYQSKINYKKINKFIRKKNSKQDKNSKIQSDKGDQQTRQSLNSSRNDLDYET